MWRKALFQVSEEETNCLVNSLSLSFFLSPLSLSHTVETVTLNDSVIADPQFIVAIPGSEGYSLCYKVHGAANHYFNLISDTCVSANAYYTAMSEDRRRNRMTKIGVRAASRGAGCVEVEVDYEGCVARVGGMEVNGAVTVGQVRVSRPRLNLWRVSAPNCQRLGLVMWISCRPNRLRFNVNRGSNLRPSSHGLLGQPILTLPPSPPPLSLSLSLLVRVCTHTHTQLTALQSICC